MRVLISALVNSLLNVGLVCAALLWFVYQSPLSPLPNALNPFTPFDLNDPVTVITWRKLDLLTVDANSCLETLQALSVSYEKREDFQQTDQCGIPQRILLTGLRDTAIGPVETQCHIAVRLALWERDILQSASNTAFSEPVAEVLTQGSYNCRAVRTENGNGSAMSEHATANAMDVKGVKLASGREILLERDWNGFRDGATFLREIGKGGCNLFRATLGPEYNSLHEDHFHFDAGRFRICR
ncbi:MAG: extensin family protein [Pseudomonadota bacterium]